MPVPLRYNVRSLFVRKVSTFLTIGSIALMVMSMVALGAMAAGLEAVMRDAADPGNAIVLGKNADSELSSRIAPEALPQIRVQPEIRQGEDGVALASAESLALVSQDKKAGGRTFTLVRGVGALGMTVHDRVKVVEGRSFAPGASEMIVGRGISRLVTAGRIGDRVRIGGHDFTVVGVFEADGSAAESEFWTSIEEVQMWGKRDWYSSVNLKLRSPADLAPMASRIEADPRLQAKLVGEIRYYEDINNASRQYRSLALAIGIILALGSVFAGMNTMYAAVAHRTPEIATLRALGFRPGAVLLSFLVEAAFLGLGGGALGCLLALPVQGIQWDTIAGQSFSTVPFTFRLTARMLLLAVAFAVGIGVVGGFWPARAAARLDLKDALRA